MLKFHGPIPITIRPMFWLFAAIIGFLYSQSIVGTFFWIGIIFISVLFHELGHALTARMFGKKPRIELVALGGLTFHEGQDLPYWKQFIITLNGPVFGFFLGMFAWAVGRWGGIVSEPYVSIVQDIFVINIFWTVVNLIPVLPLDGGQLLRIAFEGFFGAKGFGYALMAGLVIAVLISLFFFLMQSFLIGALFFLFAYQNFEMWRRTRAMGDKDRHEDLQALLLKAEEALLMGQISQAMNLLTTLREQTKKGLLWATATQQLALLEYQAGHRDAAYALLLEVQHGLGGETACILHELAFDARNFSLVTELSPRAFQIRQEADVALRSAMAFAQLGQVKPAMGWLHAAAEHGVSSIKEVVQREYFDPIRDNPLFQKFIAKESGSS
ncbi:MAG: site-2 protease family protein [Simkania sp.]|nr:site-2 protease family protein [Simkania sp.]